jgi:hypothetical protein
MPLDDPITFDSSKRSKILQPWRLSENETFSSFITWKNALIFYTGENYALFFQENTTWSKQGKSNNRGMSDDPATANPKLSAAEKCSKLNKLLDIIGQLVPTYLTNEIRNECESIQEVYQVIRQYYGFEQSEATFIDFIDIKMEEGERPERLYHRMRSSIIDNLLTTDSDLSHDHKKCVENERLSPTLERLIVLLWLRLIHPGLPTLVRRTFANDLQTKTLKDLRPLISRGLPSMLEELQNADPTVNYSRGTPHFKGRSRTSKPNYSSRPPRAQCSFCSNQGKSSDHNIEECRLLSFADKKRLARAFQISITNEDQPSSHDENNSDQE